MPIISNKRKARAKKVAIVSIVGLLGSLSLFLFYDGLSGIFSGLIFTALPSIVNLVDD
jgi:hypothetical protein